MFESQDRGINFKYSSWHSERNNTKLHALWTFKTSERVDQTESFL